MINQVSSIRVQELAAELETSALILKKQWGKIKTDFEYLIQPFEENSNMKIWMIENLASDLGFLKQTVIWDKRCTGHNYRYNTKPLREKKADKLIEKYIQIFSKDPAVWQQSIKGEKIHIKKPNGRDKKNRYDVRMQFEHKPNFPGCQMAAKQISNYEWVTISSVLTKLDQYIQSRVPEQFQESKNGFYTTLYHTMTQ